MNDVVLPGSGTILGPIAAANEASGTYRDHAPPRPSLPRPYHAIHPGGFYAANEGRDITPSQSIGFPMGVKVNSDGLIQNGRLT